MRILIAGDFFCGWLDPSQRCDNPLDGVTPLIQAVDYAIVNYESPVSCASDRPIAKAGPGLKSSVADLDTVRRAGFDGVTLANNHVLDMGHDSLMYTLEQCRERGLDVVGAGRDLQDAARTLFARVSDRTLAIINCCEHEFSVAGEQSPGTNPLNPVQQYYAITQARSVADHVIVIVHGGHEHFNLPSPRMQELYRFMIDAGADAVVNHHQHCVSGYEVYRGKPIFYGLGNFYFPRAGMSAAWNEGYMVELTLDADAIGYELHPYVHKPAPSRLELLEGAGADDFGQRIQALNSIIADPGRLRDEHAEWMRRTSREYKAAILPYENRRLLALWRRGLLPSLISRKRILRYINYIDCESHRDRMLDYLKSEV